MHKKVEIDENKLNFIVLKVFQNIHKDGNLSNSFLRQHCSDTKVEQRRRQKLQHMSYVVTSMSLFNIDVTSLIKILVTNSKTIKNIKYYDQV